MHKVTRWMAEHLATDDFGNEYVVHEYQEFIESVSHQGVSWIPGMKSFEIDGHGLLNYIDDRTFKIVRTDTIVRLAPKPPPAGSG
jgi:hypothetical protein